MSLRDPLDDLLAEVPSYVVPDARSAWAAGSRRRSRRRAGAAVLVVVLLVLAGAAVTALPRTDPVGPAGGPDGAAGSYPTRIDHPLWLRDFRGEVDPVAGVLQQRSGAWLVVSQDGGLRRLPDAGGDHPVSVSPDGTRLAYLDDRPGQEFTVREVGSSAVASWSIGAEGADPELGYEPWTQPPGTRSFWSPDSERVLVPVDPAADNTSQGVDALVLRPGAGAQQVRLPAGDDRAVAAGWASDDELVWVVARGTGPDAKVRALVTALDGRLVRRRVPLSLPDFYDRVDRAAWQMSPDGTRLAVTQFFDDLMATTWTLDLETGQQVDEPQEYDDVAVGCPPAFWGPWAVTASGTGDGVLAVSPGQPVMVADPRVGVTCSAWSDALSGTPYNGLSGAVFGDGTSWLSWHWRELGLGGAVTATALALLWVRRRRRARLSG
jgi:hypothetical protein